MSQTKRYANAKTIDGVEPKKGDKVYRRFDKTVKEFIVPGIGEWAYLANDVIGTPISWAYSTPCACLAAELKKNAKERKELIAMMIEAECTAELEAEVLP